MRDLELRESLPQMPRMATGPISLLDQRRATPAGYCKLVWHLQKDQGRARDKAGSPNEPHLRLYIRLQWRIIPIMITHNRGQEGLHPIGVEEVVEIGGKVGGNLR
jgi:hypothetical protein